jgi:hypothetical protein
VAVDEELDILRRSRSEITESLCSSSVWELEDRGGEGGDEDEDGGVGKAGFGCDVTGRWFCKTPAQFAESLRLLLRWRWGTERDWDCSFTVKGRHAEDRGSVRAIIDGSVTWIRWRGGWLSLGSRLNEPRERLRWFPLGTVIGVWEGNTANNIREGSSMVGVKERDAKDGKIMIFNDIRPRIRSPVVRRRERVGRNCCRRQLPFQSQPGRDRESRPIQILFARSRASFSV